MTLWIRGGSSICFRLIGITGGIVLAMGLCVRHACAQQDMPSKVPLSFNKYHTYTEISQAMRDLATAYPDLATLTSLGKSLQGRDMWMLTLSGKRAGHDIPDTGKPAMWIDGAVHANEVQAAEAVLYTAWYLTKAYGVNKDLTDLMDRSAFYLVPMVNPDSRDAWFKGPSNPHNSRHNQRPVDQDRDGLFDEDGPDDLDGDGELTTMWREDPLGRWERDKDDPRVFRRVAEDKAPGGWSRLGEEGLDNDGDGQINEDPPGGDDMNRNWPAGWLPEYVQWGAGEFPFSNSETRAIGDFIEKHPNIAAAQSYHNAGGMILHGAGAPFREWAYPREDTAVYDEIAKVGEQLLPYYRSMIIHKDLYTVHGGFVNWTAESLGIFSFTNEMWTEAKYFQRDQANPSPEQDKLWRDLIAFGQTFVPYKEFNHPTYGKILIGGPNRWSSRNTPTFMLEEECHRNFAFTMYHADCMPRLKVERVDVRKASEGLWEIKVAIRNDKTIPTRSRHAANKSIGEPDLLTLTGAKVAASGRVRTWLDDKTEFVDHEPARVLLNRGVDGNETLIWRFFVEGAGPIKIRYDAEKAQAIETEIELKENQVP